MNFEASFPDLIRKGRNAELFNQQEPLEKRVASFDGLFYVAFIPSFELCVRWCRLDDLSRACWRYALNYLG